jgi:hypothetical protein
VISTQRTQRVAEERARLKGHNREQISELKSQIEDLRLRISDFPFLFLCDPLCPLRLIIPLSDLSADK